MNPHELIKCQCLHCGGNIEFDADAAGQEIICPHCTNTTWVDVPGKFSYQKVKQPPKEFTEKLPEKSAAPVTKPATSGNFIQIFSVLCFLGGCALAYSGMSQESDELARVQSSAIRQAVYSLWYCTGFILMALSPIIYAAGIVVRRIMSESIK